MKDRRKDGEKVRNEILERERERERKVREIRRGEDLMVSGVEKIGLEREDGRKCCFRNYLSLG